MGSRSLVNEHPETRSLPAPLAGRADTSGGPDACWPWTGYRNRWGYPRTYLPGHSRRAHRVAWELTNGREAPAGMAVAHRCHNRACVNPAHLHLATAAENTAESMEAGRLARGERLSPHPDGMVAVALAFWHDGWEVPAIARVFELHPSTVRNWTRGRLRAEQHETVPAPRRRSPQEPSGAHRRRESPSGAATHHPVRQRPSVARWERSTEEV